MNVEYTQILIDRIRSLCSQWGYTITELAYQSGLKHSTVDNIINGRSFHPQIITLPKIAIAFNMTVAEVLDFEPLNSYSFDEGKDEGEESIASDR